MIPILSIENITLMPHTIFLGSVWDMNEIIIKSIKNTHNVLENFNWSHILELELVYWHGYHISIPKWCGCVVWPDSGHCIMNACLTVMREFYGEEKTDMEWKSSSSSKSAAPKPCWVAHCLDSFTEQWQESSVPQLIHWYCDKYKIWRRCLYFVSTCHMQTGMFGRKTLTIHWCAVSVMYAS